MGLLMYTGKISVGCPKTSPNYSCAAKFSSVTHKHFSEPKPVEKEYLLDKMKGGSNMQLQKLTVIIIIIFFFFLRR